MILYHGSPNKLPIGDHLRTPTGNSNWDVTNGGVVYLTEHPEQCWRYGIVHEVEVSEAISYAEQRKRQGLSKKKGRFTRGVYVTLPENTEIKGII